MAKGEREGNGGLHPTFSVDTHFREQGELLVGRDSTALIELTKNSYDADATGVVVTGDFLSNPDGAYIAVRDNGHGMSREEFAMGFLRIASRTKKSGVRRSERFMRRYTGAKGIGRLAPHKLARVVEVISLRRGPNGSQTMPGVEATIRWDVVERYSASTRRSGRSCGQEGSTSRLIAFMTK